MINSGDTAWMLIACALVLLMTLPGLALFYAGLVHTKNALSTAMQSFATACLVALVWVIAGYSLAFTNGHGAFAPWIGDLSRILGHGMVMKEPLVLGQGVEGAVTTTIPEATFMMFQMTFAIIAPALIAGAFAGRMKFKPLLWFMGLWSLFVYVPVAHWVWHPTGILFHQGVLDYAGGTVVHINAGIAGLVCALVMGRRLGYGDEPMPPHNTLLSLVGASLLWVGWFGFNAGSALAADGRAAMAALVTTVAAAAGGLSWMAAEWHVRRVPSIVGITSGAVAGLVAITPAAGFVDLTGAVIIGLASGIICYYACTRLKEKFRYDDSLDCFGIHGIAGIVGALLTGVFATSAITGSATPQGLIDGNYRQIWVQIQGVVVTALWAAFATYIILVVLRATMGLRVSEVEERHGLDLALHGESLVDA